MLERNNIKNGFTLIELLVVVLIVGFLAAVALPQYQKAVERSRAAEALTLLKSVVRASEAYRLASGAWPTKFEELVLDIPWTGNRKACNSDGVTDTFSNDDWSIQFYKWPANQHHAVWITRLRGKYKGARFTWNFTHEDPTFTGRLRCWEATQTGGETILFDGPAGAYCSKVMHGKPSGAVFLLDF